jgi:hypothetical protein
VELKMKDLDEVAKLLVLQGIKKLASDADTHRLGLKKNPIVPDNETSDGTPVDEEALQEAVAEGVDPDDLPDSEAPVEPDGDEENNEGDLVSDDESSDKMAEDDGDDDMAKLRKKKASMK